MVVEDERLVALDLQMCLEGLGYTVPAVVYSGKNALKKVKELMPDLVLMDIVLEDQLNGIQVADRIRSRFDVPVVYVSAYVDEKRIMEAKRTEPFGYILKPFDEKELRIVIEMALYKHGMEKKLKESEEKYRSLIEKSLQGVFVVQDSRIVFANRAFADISGFTVQELLSFPPQKVESIVHPDDQDRVWGNFKDRIAGKPVAHRYEYRGIKKDGSVRWLEMFVSRVDYCGKPAIQAAIVDITERKQTEEELRKTKDYVQNIIDCSLDMIVTVDKDRHIVEFNKAACETFGYSKEEIVGKSVQILYANEDEGFSVESQVSKNEKFIGEIQNIRKNGEVFTALLSASVLRDENGNVIGKVGNSRDISERKKEEQQIRVSLNEKEILLKEIHHRVKNNMQVISSLLSLQSRNIKNRRVLEMFKESQDRVRSMLLVHEKLLKSRDFTRIDFAEYIRSLAYGLYRTYGLDPEKILLDIQVEAISLGIDLSIPCGLVINELISNALKHGFPKSWEGKGKITVSLGKTEDEEIVLIVKDNGVGIPKDFDFRKTETMGLSLVTILIEDQLRGKIRLDRRRGTKFHIRFKEF